jgi:hypothetical protein
VRRIQKPIQVSFLGQPIQCVEKAPGTYTSAQVSQAGEEAAKRLDVLGFLLNRRIGLSARNGVLLCKQLIHPIMDLFMCQHGGPLLAATSGTCQFYNPSVFALRIARLCSLVTGKVTSISGFHSSSTTSEHREFRYKVS